MLCTLLANQKASELNEPATSLDHQYKYLLHKLIREIAHYDLAKTSLWEESEEAAASGSQETECSSTMSLKFALQTLPWTVFPGARVKFRCCLHFCVWRKKWSQRMSCRLYRNTEGMNTRGALFTVAVC